MAVKYYLIYFIRLILLLSGFSLEINYFTIFYTIYNIILLFLILGFNLLPKL